MAFHRIFQPISFQYELISSLGFAIVNGPSSQCVLIQKLEAYLNSNSTVNSTSPATLLEAKAYLSELKAYFDQVTDIVLRLKFIISQLSTKSEACRTSVYAAEITEEWDFADVHTGCIYVN
jgi:hypothetical protein